MAYFSDPLMVEYFSPLPNCLSAGNTITRLPQSTHRKPRYTSTRSFPVTAMFAAAFSGSLVPAFRCGRCRAHPCGYVFKPFFDREGGKHFASLRSLMEAYSHHGSGWEIAALKPGHFGQFNHIHVIAQKSNLPAGRQRIFSRSNL
jgi:hypothetical protein